MLVPGQVYRASYVVGDGSVAAEQVVLTITGPDSKNVDPMPAVVNDPPGTGSYYYDFTLPAPGLWRFAWVTVNPNTSLPPDYQNVRDYVSIVSMEEVLAHLNKPDPGDDYLELTRFMMCATELVEMKVGPCVPRIYTEVIAPPNRNAMPMEIVVNNPPLTDVTSIASNWIGGPVWDNRLSPGVLAFDPAGTIYQPSSFAFWWGPWTVTYTAGRPVIPERFIYAAQEEIRHLWQTQRGSNPPATLGTEEVYTSTTGFTFSVPRRVLELLQEDTVPSL